MTWTEGILWASLAVVLLGAALLMRPLTTPPELRSKPRPAKSYEHAVALVRELSNADTSAISTECRTLFMNHGGRTPRVVVMLHGLTNCPAQFEVLGRLCFERGDNVLIPRLPRHGLADRMTDELARTDAEELREFTDRALDPALGLGDHVTVVGLSIGGTLAAWAGQNRSDVDRAVLIAPVLDIARVPDPLDRLVIRLFRVLPNFHVWWDWRRGEKLLGPKHVYPRFATRAVAATLVIGAAVLEQARRLAPACRSAAIVTVGGDRAVGRHAPAVLARVWRARACEVTEYEFPSSLHLNHDVVDPEQVGANPSVTYPVLLRLIDPDR
jgi:carboxylesterase